MTPQRKRGRPLGSGKAGDDMLLASVADILLAEPHLKCAAAIKRAVPAFDDTIIRRLRDKFNARREPLLAEADARRTAQRNSERDTHAQQLPDHQAERSRRLAALSASPRGYAALLSEKLMEVSAAARLKALYESQTLPALREHYLTPNQLILAQKHMSKLEIQTAIGLAKRMVALNRATS